VSADPDYYELLQVPYDADSKEIISTYRLLARQYHPDLAKDSSATKRMLALNKAIEVLGDPKKRREYDARRLQARAREALAREAAQAGADDKAGRSRAPARKRAPDPRHTRAVTTHRPGPARKPTKPIAQPPAPKSRPVALVLGLGAAAFGLLTAVVIAFTVSLGGGSQEAAFTQPTSSNETTPVSTAPASSASPRPTESPFLPGSDVFESRGIWFVGADMAPGVWRAVRAVNCTWKRLSARDPTDEAVVGSGSSLTVELHPSDVAFWSEGCGWWTQILTPPSASPTEPFGPGTWLVGQEVAPGSWQNSNSSAQCSWARLKTLDGGSLAAISSGTTGADGLVIEIGTDDVAFHSWGCGTWTRATT
jgi:hypothetical protein